MNTPNQLKFLKYSDIGQHLQINLNIRWILRRLGPDIGGNGIMTSMKNLYLEVLNDAE